MITNIKNAVPKIAIIVPVYNEEASLHRTYHELIKICDQHTEYIWEILFVDDGSKDSSWFIIAQFAQYDNRVHAIKFSRNFGHQIALSAGYEHAQADAVVSIDADLQDPPYIISNLIKEWKNGNDIVYARRIDRKDSLFKKVSAHLYYYFLHKIADVEIPRNVGDFRLLDKKVVRYLIDCKEKSRYLRGMVAWSGFQHTFVDFHRAPRMNGTTGYSLKKMIRLACDGLTSFSTFPLKIAGFLGTFIVFSAMFIIIYQGLYIFLGNSSFNSTHCYFLILYFVCGLQCICIWLIGEYIARIYEQQKERPLYIIEKRIETSSVTHLTASKETHHENRSIF